MKKHYVCKKCQKIFESETNEEYCQPCCQIVENKFRDVRKYIRRNKGIGLEAVVEACDVPLSQLLRWVREERIFFDESSKVTIPCLVCGTSIRIGKYCDHCKKDIKRQLRSVSHVEQECGQEKVKRACSHYFHTTKSSVAK